MEESSTIKGRRTKRHHRLPTNIAATPTTTATSSKSDQQEASSDSSGSIPDASSSHLYSTNEEQDLANCLILLAQGQSPVQLTHHLRSTSKLMQDSSSFSNKALFECKTCSKNFPSFQALGGHRASHKKPKINEFTPPRPKNLLLSDIAATTNKIRVHECSICGAEFISGQALGGHMRRHRAPVYRTAATTPSLTKDDDDDEEKIPSSGYDDRGIKLSVDLDLNLPALPEAEDITRLDSKFHLAATQQPPAKPAEQQLQQPQQKQLVFSPPTLVGCQY